MKSIREIFGVDYLLNKLEVAPEPESDKLWDRVVWTAEADFLNDAIMKRIRAAIKEKVKDACWKNNRAKVTKDDIINAVRELHLHSFIDSED